MAARRCKSGPPRSVKSRRRRCQFQAAVFTDTTTGFYKYSVDAYGIYTLTSTDVTGAYTAQKVTNVYNSLVSFADNTSTFTVRGTDLSAANAKIVDLRTAATISTDGIAAISTVEGIASAMATKTVNCAVTVDLTVTGTPITVIYVTSLSAIPAT